METTVDFVLKYSNGEYVPKSAYTNRDNRNNHFNARSFHTSESAIEMRDSHYTRCIVLKRVSVLSGLDEV